MNRRAAGDPGLAARKSSESPEGGRGKDPPGRLDGVHKQASTGDVAMGTEGKKSWAREVGSRGKKDEQSTKRTAGATEKTRKPFTVGLKRKELIGQGRCCNDQYTTRRMGQAHALRFQRKEKRRKKRGDSGVEEKHDDDLALKKKKQKTKKKKKGKDSGCSFLLL